MVFYSVKQLLQEAESRALPLWQLILDASAEESGISPEQSWDMMSQRLQAMRLADSSYDPAQRSKSGLSGGDGEKMRLQYESGRSICGDFVGSVLSAALRMGECNACMHRIVAAPTAGSAGVLPGVLLALQEEKQLSNERLHSAILNASAIGYILMRNASVSGAEAGCQAEVGAASAMAASAVVEIMGGTPEMSLEAASIAMSNLLGMVCDPIAGLVESPCQSRNTIGAANAITCAELALAGVTHPIPFDEMAEAMYRVGKSIPFELRETAMGGCAGTPTGCTLGCHACSKA